MSISVFGEENGDGDNEGGDWPKFLGKRKENDEFSNFESPCLLVAPYW